MARSNQLEKGFYVERKARGDLLDSLAISFGPFAAKMPHDIKLRTPEGPREDLTRLDLITEEESRNPRLLQYLGKAGLNKYVLLRELRSSVPVLGQKRKPTASDVAIEKTATDGHSISLRLSEEDREVMSNELTFTRRALERIASGVELNWEERETRILLLNTSNAVPITVIGHFENVVQKALLDPTFNNEIPLSPAINLKN